MRPSSPWPMARVFAGPIVRLTMDCIAQDEDQYSIRPTGKRQKERMRTSTTSAPMPSRLAGRARRRAGHSSTAGAAVGAWAAGMTPQAIRDVVVRRAEQAGVKDVGPDLRRTFVSDSWTVGWTSPPCRPWRGSIQTTARYDRRGRRPSEAAVLMCRSTRRGRSRGGVVALCTQRV